MHACKSMFMCPRAFSYFVIYFANTVHGVFVHERLTLLSAVLMLPEPRKTLYSRAPVTSHKRKPLKDSNCFPRGIIYVFFIFSHLWWFGGWMVTSWIWLVGLGFSVYEVWGHGAFWVYWSWGSLHRRIYIRKKNFACTTNFCVCQCQSDKHVSRKTISL